LVDLDADGHDDITTGSYWPGDMFWFRGLGKGEFAKGQKLTDEEGKDLNAGKPWESEKKPDMDSLASVPFFVDWDGDGDLDLLAGNIAGRVIRIENAGTRQKAVFGTERSPVEAGGKVLQVGGGDSGPVCADWDGDGLWDLVVGAGDGSVVWCRNTGKAGSPEFAAPVALVPANEQGFTPIPVGEEPKGPGLRTKVHVADFDGDGQVDLLVGGYVQQALPAPEQERRRDELREQRTALQKEMQKLYRTDEEPVDATVAAERKRVSEEMQKIWKELRPLEQQNEPHGYVWVYPRKKAGTKTADR
jgi:hypothetical protein